MSLTLEKFACGSLLLIGKVYLWLFVALFFSCYPYIHVYPHIYIVL